CSSCYRNLSSFSSLSLRRTNCGQRSCPDFELTKQSLMFFAQLPNYRSNSCHFPNLRPTIVSMTRAIAIVVFQSHHETFAVPSAGTGLLWLWSMGLSCKVALMTEGLCLLFTAWGFLEGRSTHATLARNRANLLQEIRIVPPPQADDYSEAPN